MTSGWGKTRQMIECVGGALTHAATPSRQDNNLDIVFKNSLADNFPRTQAPAWVRTCSGSSSFPVAVVQVAGRTSVKQSFEDKSAPKLELWSEGTEEYAFSIIADSLFPRTQAPAWERACPGSSSFPLAAARGGSHVAKPSFEDKCVPKLELWNEGNEDKTRERGNEEK
jgi:hypothetical protein